MTYFEEKKVIFNVWTLDKVNEKWNEVNRNVISLH